MTNICIGLLAHVDAGKTTLSESLLYLSGSIRKAGRVDNRDAFLDTYEMEKEKTISGKHYERLYKNYSLNELLGELANIRLIGMPGHEPRISEMTSKQKLIYARVGVPEPVVREDTV